MRIVDKGHLWLLVEHKGINYTLAYAHGLDITVIFKDSEELNTPHEYINYFHGGFNTMTEEPYFELQNNILDNAVYYIEHATNM